MTEIITNAVPMDPSHSFAFDARGMIPASKGSYRPVSGRSKTSGKRVTRLIPMDKKEHPWRQFIVQTIHNQIAAPAIPDDAVVMILETFYMPRPKSVPYPKRFLPTVKPDIDKLQRCLHDAIVDSGLLPDDSQICDITARKRYVSTESQAGVFVEIYWANNKENKL